MKSTPMVRKTPMKRTPMVRKTGAPKITAKKKPKKRPGHDPVALAACRGEPCYLQIPGVCLGGAGIATVVPAHRNEGKGMGLKVPDAFTVPACFMCHREYDQGAMPRAEKRSRWDAAFARWKDVRQSSLEAR